jgi:hypothetical protein
MARLFIEGFEGGNTDGWTGAGTVYAIGGSGLSGNYFLSQTGSEGISRYLSASQDEIWMAFKYRTVPNSASASRIVAFADSAGTCIMTLSRNTTTGIVSLHIGSSSSGAVAAAATPIVNDGRVYLIEIHYIPLNSGGTVEVFLNGTSEISYSGDTTAGLENMKDFGFARHLQAAGSGDGYFDDIVLDDTNRIGNTKIQGQFIADSTGAATDLTASAGNTYDCIQEIPYGDAAYIYGNTNGNKSTFPVSALAESVSTIKCVQITARCAYAGTPTPTKQQLGIYPADDSTFHAHGTDITPGIGMSRYDRVWELNPGDNAAFEAADCDNMQIGVQLAA